MKVEYDGESFTLATVLGRVLEEGLKSGEKVETAKKLRGSITVECRDLKSSATIYFSGDKIVVRSGSGGKYLISADYKTLGDLTFGNAGLAKILLLLLRGELRIRGVLFAMKFRRLLN